MNKSDISHYSTNNQKCMNKLYEKICFACCIWDFSVFVVSQEDKCPSGCQMEGLIDAADENVHKRLRKICESIQQTEDIVSSVMRESAQFYGSQRKTIIQTYSRLNLVLFIFICLYKTSTRSTLGGLFVFCVCSARAQICWVCWRTSEKFDISSQEICRAWKRITKATSLDLGSDNRNASTWGEACDKSILFISFIRPESQ